MPETVGVRELKNQTSRVIRAVCEEMAEYVITLRGEPVAVLRPLTAQDRDRLRQGHLGQAMAEMKDLAQEVAAAWTSDKSGGELIAEQRR